MDGEPLTSPTLARVGGLALLVGVASGAVAVAITTRTLVEILRWFGVSN